MFGAELVTRTKFIPPRLRPPYLHRPRLYRLLDEARGVPLALVVGGTGYGKSTLLAGYLQDRGLPALWYELSERDADPQLWLLHLAHLLERAYPGVAQRALQLLAYPGGAERHGEAALEALADALLDRVEQDTWLVFDDAHWLQASPAALALANRLVHLLPPSLHLVLAARQAPALADLARWRLRGDALALGEEQLAFDEAEIAALWQSLHKQEPGLGVARRLLDATEGWPIAVQLLARRGETPTAVEQDTPAELFAYLAREVLAQLPEGDRRFLLSTAPLRRLDARLGDALAGGGAAAALRGLRDRGAFLVDLGGGVYRYHHLFREFLLNVLAEQGQGAAAQLAAAQALEARGELEDALECYLAGGDGAAAARLLLALAPALASQGRHQQLAAAAARLPAAAIDERPDLALALGDACREAARYPEALAWYERAQPGDASRALAGQARVYLDTLQPDRAEDLLQAALAQAPDAGRRADVLLLQAENRINRGEARSAEPLLRQAAGERPEAVEHEARLLLRTGRLAECRRLLETAMAGPEAAASGTGAHRERQLVLSLVESFAGRAGRARELANAAVARAKRRDAAWTQAVARMRRGHALALLGDADAAAADYHEALSQAELTRVPRLRAEPLWGLALLAARRGDPAGAESLARDGLATARATGDGWMAALLAAAAGQALAVAGDPGADAWLEQAGEGFARSGDAHGAAVVALWAAELALRRRQEKEALRRLRGLLDLVRRHDYGFLLTGPAMMGFPDAAAARDFAARALDAGLPAALLAPWLPELGLPAAPPATAATQTLQIACLGRARVRRGDEALSEKSWGRAKARELLHILVAFRGQALAKERLIDLLWPEADPEAGDRSFRVVLNALNKALEPARPQGAPPRYVLREGGRYRLAGDDAVHVDVAAFERLLDAARDLEAAGQDPLPPCLQALDLYAGPFLAEHTAYDTWCDRARDRLASRFAAGALQAVRLLSNRGDDAGAAQWAERLLAEDSCAEEACRALMTARQHQGEGSLALRAYERCAAALASELGVLPSPETAALAEQIRRREPIPRGEPM